MAADEGLFGLDTVRRERPDGERSLVRELPPARPAERRARAVG